MGHLKNLATSLQFPQNAKCLQCPILLLFMWSGNRTICNSLHWQIDVHLLWRHSYRSVVESSRYCWADSMYQTIPEVYCLSDNKCRRWSFTVNLCSFTSSLKCMHGQHRRDHCRLIDWHNAHKIGLSESNLQLMELQHILDYSLDVLQKWLLMTDIQI